MHHYFFEQTRLDIIAFKIKTNRKDAKICNNNQRSFLPEGSIEARGKLGRVSHQAGLVGNTLLNKGILDSLNTTVHHVTGRDHLASSTSISHRDIDQTLDRSTVVDRTVLAEDTAVAVRGVRAETDIAGQEKVGECFAEDFEGADRGSVGVICCRSDSILL